MKGPVKWDLLSDELKTKFSKPYNPDKTIPVFDLYKDESNASQTINWTGDLIDEYIQRFSKENIKNNQHLPEPYNNGALLHLTTFEKYSVAGKKVAVIGSLTPWIEAILINFGCVDITTVEYNVPICEHDIIKCISYDSFVNDDTCYDIIISYSSLEHSGLGRYGDEIDPDADLKATKIIHEKTRELFIVGIPVGGEAVVWNAHRIYGEDRLQLLFNGFINLDLVSAEELDVKSYSLYAPQPIYVLRKV